MITINKKHSLLIVILNVCIVSLLGVFLVVNNVFATSNQESTLATINTGVLPYQGTLINSAGNPESGAFDISFKIYDSSTAIDPLWEEDHTGINAVPVENGLFNVFLGSLNPIPDSIWEQSQLFLGVQVANDSEMSPREPIAPVPFALQAGIAQTVPTGSLNSTHVDLTSGTKMATGDIDLTTSYQVVPGMEATITLDTPQTLFISFTIYFYSNASSGYGTARVKVVGEDTSYSTPLIVKSWPSVYNTSSLSYLIDLPAGTYDIYIQAKSYSGVASVSSSWTNMMWFTFSN